MRRWRMLADDAMNSHALSRLYDFQHPTDVSTGLMRSLAYMAKPRYIILFTPHRPDFYYPPYIVYKLCVLLGYRIEWDPTKEYDIAFRFADRTIGLPDLPAIRADVPVINQGVWDISKSHVQKVWESAANYAFRINPTTHHGQALCKNNRNATHDGQVIDCPIPPDRVESGKVYQKLVDNSVGNGMVLDYRVVVHGAQIPLVYRKYRPVETRFSNDNARAELADPVQEFSEQERETVLTFARTMGLDFGELDVLRDAADGQLYVVDVNNTPCGPPNGLAPKDQSQAIGILTESFRQLVESLSECP
ncbi:hypothetical protein [Leptothoe sp. PORK10 BA2]|uniref:hypothetical protein n=1 Tax=Leptothoe sp. PORK10 BA2 TaxID=3110254 RepID=UPI002B1F55EC|nr:hypothetical protein [Leptothoe sp. PORK10 BA2]MEA5466136.1 hypothetical protein [Leptothoe sp. PORK10 BA2]